MPKPSSALGDAFLQESTPRDTRCGYKALTPLLLLAGLSFVVHVGWVASTRGENGHSLANLFGQPHVNIFKGVKQTMAASPTRFQWAPRAGGAGYGQRVPLDSPALPDEEAYDPSLDSLTVPWQKEGDGAMPGGCSFCMG